MKYEIKESPFTILECQLENGESINCQKGAMAWMSDDMEMKTKTGGVGGMFKKIISGESLFHNTYTCTGNTGLIAFGKTFPGAILDIDIAETAIISQKSAYLASTPGVEMNISFQKKIGAGFFGGEGFIMQNYTGKGHVFLEIDGACVLKELGAGEKMQLDTGNLAAMEASVSFDIKMLKGVGNILGGGEGMFNTVLTGPGKVWLQTMPAVHFAETLVPLLSKIQS